MQESTRNINYPLYCNELHFTYTYTRTPVPALLLMPSYCAQEQLYPSFTVSLIFTPYKIHT